MIQPQITAEARLPAGTVSFTGGPDPDLVISLTLVNSQTPITIPKNSQTQLFHATNAILLRDKTHHRTIPLPSLDINWRNTPAISLTPNTSAGFVTLESDERCDVVTVPFRPMGSQRKSVEGMVLGLSMADGFRFAQLGLHLLEPGCEYALQVKGGIRLSCWAEGRIEELVQQNLLRDFWAPRVNMIEVVPAEEFVFRVVE